MYIPTTLALGTNSVKRESFFQSLDTLPFVWDEMEALLLPCVEEAKGLLSLRQLYDELIQQQAVALSIYANDRMESVLIIRKVQYPGHAVARIIACGGSNLKDAMQFIDALETWAFTQGCVEIEGWCRTSVARLVKRYGWKNKLTIVSRDIRRKLQ